MRLRSLNFGGLVSGIVLLAAIAGCGGGSKSTPTPPAAPTITTSATLTPGTVGSAYTLTFAATGGTAPYTWSITAGALPAGLSLTSAGVLSGTPTAAGSSSFKVKVTDAEATPQSGTLAATLVINAPATLAITTTTPLPSGTLNTAYSPVTLAATGGVAPYAWSVSVGLPTGLALTPAGVISGTPTLPGLGSFTLTVTDSEATPQTATLAATLAVSGGTLAITTTTLPAGTQGVAYSSELAASGGVPPYVWTTGASIPLPAGLTLSASGLLSGTPTGVSDTTPSFTVTDATSAAISQNLNLIVNPAAGTIPDGQYTFMFTGTSPQGASLAQSGVAFAGTFTIASGIITTGLLDQNNNQGPTVPSIMEEVISGGTLTNGTDGLGQLVLNVPTGTITFALATPASVAPGSDSAIRMIEFDDTTGAGTRGSGVLKPASTTLPTLAGIPTGSYAFLFNGGDINQKQEALAGSVQTDGAGNITGGHADSNQVGTLLTWGAPGFPTTLGAVGGSYAVDAKGHGLFKLKLATTVFTFGFYEVSPTEWFAISLDPATLNSPLVSGEVLQQTGSGSFTAASIPATSVFQLNGLKPVTGGTTPDISIGVATVGTPASNGSVDVTYNFEEFAATLAPIASFTVNYAVDPTTGRAVSTGTVAQPILYIIDSTRAFLLGPDNSSSSGLVEAQTSTAFSGNYLGGSVPLANSTVLNEAGIVAADGAGNVVLTTNQSTQQGLVLYQNVTGTYVTDSVGRTVVTVPGDTTTRIFYVISANKVAYLSGEDGGYLGSFQQ